MLCMIFFTLSEMTVSNYIQIYIQNVKKMSKIIILIANIM